ncbi:MAG: type II toxin-antitoxin system prevent-host-death family antitoxin [Dehalococcoidia bacterium]
MIRIGVRELRQRASEYLDQVAAGETVEITRRGRRIALIIPPPAGIVERLKAEGRLTGGSGDLRDLPPPVPRKRGQRPLSEVLAEMREDERY